MKRIYHQKTILIDAAPEHVFDIIYTMPKKFPVYRLMETRPFLFIRLLLVNGPRPAIEGVKTGLPADMLELKPGDAMGPFTLSECERPSRYMFTLRSLFFDCTTGYTIEGQDGKTSLQFELDADDPSLAEKTWWFFVKPVHVLFGRKVLKNIKRMAESSQKEAV